MEEEIMHLAKLAALKLTDEEVKKYSKDMEEIIKFAGQVNEVNTDGINTTASTLDIYNVFRKDEVKDFGDKEALLQNAPSQDEGMFRIPKVIN